MPSQIPTHKKAIWSHRSRWNKYRLAPLLGSDPLSATSAPDQKKLARLTRAAPPPSPRGRRGIRPSRPRPSRLDLRFRPAPFRPAPFDLPFRPAPGLERKPQFASPPHGLGCAACVDSLRYSFFGFGAGGRKAAPPRMRRAM